MKIITTKKLTLTDSEIDLLITTEDLLDRIASALGKDTLSLNDGARMNSASFGDLRIWLNKIRASAERA